MTTDTKPTAPTQPLSVRLRALAAKETAAADAATVPTLNVFAAPISGERCTHRAQAFNEAASMAEEGEAAGAALTGDVVSGAEYRGVRDRLVAAAIDLANARKERDEAVATADYMAKSLRSAELMYDDAIERIRSALSAGEDESTVEAARRVAAMAERLQHERDGVQLGTYLTPAEAMAAKLERERLAKVFDHSADCADKRATECAGRKDYEDNVRAASVWRNAAAECRRVSA